MSHVQRPTVRAPPGLSAAAGSVLLWKRCVTSTVIAGIGQMSLLGNVVSTEALVHNRLLNYYFTVFNEGVCRFRMLVMSSEKNTVVNLLFFLLQAPMSASTTTAAALTSAMTLRSATSACVPLDTVWLTRNAVKVRNPRHTQQSSYSQK